MAEIYPQELSLTSDDATVRANYLDLSIEIQEWQDSYKVV